MCLRNRTMAFHRPCNFRIILVVLKATRVELKHVSSLNKSIFTGFNLHLLAIEINFA